MQKEIEKHVMPLIELGKEGGLVIGQASIGDDISQETYNYYMQLVNGIKYSDIFHLQQNPNTSLNFLQKGFF